MHVTRKRLLSPDEFKIDATAVKPSEKAVRHMRECFTVVSNALKRM